MYKKSTRTIVTISYIIMIAVVLYIAIMIITDVLRDTNNINIINEPKIGAIYSTIPDEDPFDQSTTSIRILDAAKDKNNKWWIKYHYCYDENCTDAITHPHSARWENVSRVFIQKGDSIK